MDKKAPAKEATDKKPRLEALEGGGAMSTSAMVVLVTAVVLLSFVAWFDARCLADLRETSDRQLRLFDRNTWALIIVISFPIGPMLYLMYGKGPGRRTW